MGDVDTFLTTLYVMIDDFCKTNLPPEPHPGTQALLSREDNAKWGRIIQEAGIKGD